MNGDKMTEGYDEDALDSQPRPQAVLEKRCPICRKVKPREDFYARHDGVLYAYCKPCHRNYNRARREHYRRENPPAPRKPKHEGECEFEGCTNTAKSRALIKQTDTEKAWVCSSHWNHYSAGQDMRPLKTYAVSRIDDNIRQCTSCDAIKPVDAFYARSGGAGRQSACRDCQKLTNRFNTLHREGRLEKALELTELMPERLREKYAGILSQTINKSGESQ